MLLINTVTQVVEHGQPVGEEVIIVHLTNSCYIPKAVMVKVFCKNSLITTSHQRVEMLHITDNRKVLIGN